MIDESCALEKTEFEKRLKPCPFCGDRDIFIRDEDGEVFAWCLGCGAQSNHENHERNERVRTKFKDATIKSNDIDEVIASWNSRARPICQVSQNALVAELRNKASRDNRALLDESADAIESLSEEVERLHKIMDFVAREMEK